MLKTGIIILLAAIVASYAPELIDRFWVSFLPICLFVAYINRSLRILGVFLSCFLWVTFIMHWQLDHRLASDQNNKRVVAIGEVLNIPKTTRYATMFYFKPLSIAGFTGQLPQKVKLNWRNAPDNLQPGQIWQLNLKLKRPHGFQNPGGFDYERWMFTKGVHATGYVIKSAHNDLMGTNPLSLNSLRFNIKKHIDGICTNCNNTGLIEALAIGYRGSIPPLTNDLLSQTGTAHLIAVSGLHIGIVSAVFYAVGLSLWSGLFYRGRLKRKELALLLAWSGGLCYSLLSGFELPAQRAMLMLTVVLLSFMLRSPFNLLHSLSSALVLVIIVSPLAVLSASFWLTFSALMVISLGVFLLQQQFSRLKQLIVIQLLFSILFIPLSIFIFGQVHSASMAANLIAVPLVSFIIVPLNFILLMLFWLPQDLLQAMYGILDSLLDVLINYLQFLQKNGLQAIDVAFVDGWQLLVFLIFIILLLIPRGILSKALLLLFLPPVIFWQFYPQQKIKLKMTVLDVGMGTAIVLQTTRHSLIYDFGPGNDNGYSLGEWVVYPYLKYEGISKPDRIVISHADQDHSGGFYALQDKLKGIPIFSGTPQEIKNKFPNLEAIDNCHQTTSWVWDSVKFEFLTSQSLDTDSENDRSCVLKVSYRQHSLLITGDIEAKQEKKLLLKDKQALKAQILVAPHHGSMTSSTQAFIEAVGAEQVVFTTGYLNRWKFPRTETKQRYITAGSEIMQTDLTGAIQFRCSDENCSMVKFRQQYPQLWY